MMQPDKMRVVLTGATGGIGSELARQLYSRGASLLLVGRNEIALENLKAQLGERVQVCCADITLHEDRQKLVNASSAFQANVLVNSAGMNVFSLLEDNDESDVEAVFSLNVVSVIALVRAMLPSLLEHRPALLVNVGSILGSIGMPGYTLYCSSKFALRGFTEALQREYADTQNLIIKYIAPRATKTAINSASVCAMNSELGNAMDEPAAVASEIIDFMCSSGNMRFMGWPEKLFVKINAVLPAMVSGSFMKQLPVIRRYARQERGTGS
ncbi:MAG: SDR family oxidoreductase [Pseudomonadales bacterium]|nr:SDR family oxidoreductase [Pseudomonadales bacterium]